MKLTPDTGTDKLLHFLKKDYANNLYFFNYIRCCRGPDPCAAILTARHNGEIVLALLISAVHCCVAAGDKNIIAAVASQLPPVHSTHILGRYDLTNELLDYTVGPERKNKIYNFCRFYPEKLPNPTNTRSKKASHEDYDRLVSFYLNNDMLPNCEKRLKYILSCGTAYFVRENEAIVSCALTTTETGDMTMVGSVYTAEAHRHRGYARDCLVNLYGDLAGRKKEVYLFYEADDEKLAKMYRNLGFVKIDKWLLSTVKQ